MTEKRYTDRMTHMPIRLSKTRVMSGLQCPKRLYLQVHRPDLLEGSQSGNIRLIHGQQVGLQAQQLYPDGVLIGHPLDAEQALHDTQHYMGRSSDALFEAAFEHEGVLVRTDIFVEDGGYHVVEVKASTSLKKHHLQDCAIQAWVLEEASLTLESISVAYVNREYVYRGGGDYTGFFYIQNVTQDILPLKAELPGQLKALWTALDGDTPEIDVGDHCKQPVACPFTDFCALKTTEYPVTLFPRSKKLASELIAAGFEDIRDVPENHLENGTLERIRRVTQSGDFELDSKLVLAVRNLGWPRYYLDFETIQFAVPIWNGTRPYSQLPFQWSCHIEHELGKLEHAEFLDVTGDTPIRKFAESLVESLGKEGPIIVYSHFEKSRLNELAERFPDLAGELYALVDRLVDLLPLTRKHYYHPAMRGSYSIKAVLPTVAPELNYKALDQVHNGEESQMAYMEFIDSETDAKRKAQLEQALLEYCRLDTLAMVEMARFYAGHDA